MKEQRTPPSRELDAEAEARVRTSFSRQGLMEGRGCFADAFALSASSYGRFWIGTNAKSSGPT